MLSVNMEHAAFNVKFFKMQIFYFTFKLYISECVSIIVKIYTYIRYIFIFCYSFL